MSIVAGLGGELLERDELMARLDGLLARVRADSEGTVLWVGGEAGVALGG
jgi:hypothetical protein